MILAIDRPGANSALVEVIDKLGYWVDALLTDHKWKAFALLFAVVVVYWIRAWRKKGE